MAAARLRASPTTSRGIAGRSGSSERPRSSGGLPMEPCRQRDNIANDLNPTFVSSAHVQNECRVGLAPTVTRRGRKSIIWMERTPLIVGPVDHVQSIIRPVPDLGEEIECPPREIHTRPPSFIGA